MNYPSRKLTLLIDLIGMTVMFAPFILSVTTLYYLLHSLQLHLLLATILCIILLPFLFIFFCFIVRLLLPKLKKGRFKQNLNKGYVAWGLHLFLGRSIRIFQLKDLIYSSYILKFLYWRAMGARIAFGINSSMYVNIIDLPLVTIDENATLGDEVQLSCHIIADNHLVLGNIKIGEGSFVSFGTQIGPMTKIGKRCFIGPKLDVIKLKLKDDGKYPSKSDEV